MVETAAKHCVRSVAALPPLVHLCELVELELVVILQGLRLELLLRPGPVAGLLRLAQRGRLRVERREQEGRRERRRANAQASTVREIVRKCTTPADRAVAHGLIIVR